MTASKKPAAKSRYHLQAPISDALSERARDIVERLRDGRLKAAQSDEVSDLICDITDSSMRHFFARPAQDFGLGLTARGIIDLGVRSTSKTVRMALRQILPRLSPEQFQRVADYLEEALPALAKAVQ